MLKAESCREEAHGKDARAGEKSGVGHFAKGEA
jgi:hypothetical protein